MNSISPTANVGNYAQSFLDGTAARAPKQQLDGDDFLKLLTTQLSNQDPMKPMEDTAFMAQMASFSSLEQMKALATNMATFAGQQGIAAASNYLGKTVTVTPPNSTSTSGVVTGVTIEAGKPKLQINGASFDAADLTSIKETLTTPVSNNQNTTNK